LYEYVYVYVGKTRKNCKTDMRTLLFYRRLAIVSKAVAGHRDTLTVNRNIPHAVNA